MAAFKANMFGGRARIERCLEQGGHFVGRVERLVPNPAGRPAGKQKGEGYNSIIVYATCSNCGCRYQLPEGTKVLPLENEDD